jgi:replication factor C subunit 1
MSPFDLTSRLFRSQEFNETTLQDKIDLFFIDYQMLPLFVQENYIRNGFPALARSAATNQVDMELRSMDLMAQAAESISDGDLVDNLIRGHQQWGLLPLQSVFSCVRPAYFCHRSVSQPTFPMMLGNMSKTSKNYRLLKELQIHMRVHISGDKSEIRQSYLPALIPRLTTPLLNNGVVSVLFWRS